MPAMARPDMVSPRNAKPASAVINGTDA